MCVFIFYLSLGNCVAVYLEIAAHSAYDMFSKYKYLIVNLVFPTSVFWSGNFFLRLFLIIAYLYLLITKPSDEYHVTYSLTFEPSHEKTNNVHRRKQRRRSASW